MAIPQPIQARTAQRALVEYTVGEPDKKADLPTAASSPTISSLATNPLQYVTIGLCAATQSVAVAAQVVGAIVTIDTTVPMASFPQGLQFGITDQVFFDAIVNIDHTYSGLVLQSMSVTPQGFGGLRFYTGPVLSNAVAYSSYNVRVIATYYVTSAISLGKVNVNVRGQLFDLPG